MIYNTQVYTVHYNLIYCQSFPLLSRVCLQLPAATAVMSVGPITLRIRGGVTVVDEKIWLISYYCTSLELYSFLFRSVRFKNSNNTPYLARRLQYCTLSVETMSTSPLIQPILFAEECPLASSHCSLAWASLRAIRASHLLFNLTRAKSRNFTRSLN
jgi:hypothetical protein